VRQRPKRVSGPLSDGADAYPWPVPRDGEFGEVVWDGLAYCAPKGRRPLFCDLHVPRVDSPPPLVIWLHGGGWIAGSRRRESPNLEPHWLVGRTLLAGFAVALADYRMIGETVFPGPVADVRAAIRWLRANAAALRFDGSRIGLWGESAGAHLACLAATCDRAIPLEPETEGLAEDGSVAALVAWYGPADLARMPSTEGDADAPRASADRDVLAGSSWDAHAASPLTYVRADSPPTFIAHGRDDDVVPVEHGREYAAALRDAGAEVEYAEVAGGHVFDGADTAGETIGQSIDFLRRRLEPAPPVSPPPTESARLVWAVGEECSAACEAVSEGRDGDVAGLVLLAPTAVLEAAELRGLPAVLLAVGAEDPSLITSLAFAAKLRDADVPLALRVIPGAGKLRRDSLPAGIRADVAALADGTAAWVWKD
jgi:acetyl esterase/lipase